MPTLLRASIFHTPKSPFEEAGALECFADGALAFEGEKILAVGDYVQMSKKYPEAEVLDHRDAFLFPGFVDTHVHLPQLPVIGAMGLRLLEWLEQRTLPIEERFADERYARDASKTFLSHLVKNGTTTALVFGSHFAGAMDLFFEEAEASGLRITSGLVVSDRNLTERLHRTPEEALLEGRALIKRWHKPRATALRGHAALLALLHGRDALGVRRPLAGNARPPFYESLERTD